MDTNKTLVNYDLSHNGISEDGIDSISEIITEAPHVSWIGVSEFFSQEVYQKLLDAMAANAKAKKGAKKKKKK